MRRFSLIVMVRLLGLILGMAILAFSSAGCAALGLAPQISPVPAVTGTATIILFVNKTPIVLPTPPAEGTPDQMIIEIVGTPVSPSPVTWIDPRPSYTPTGTKTPLPTRAPFLAPVASPSGTAGASPPAGSTTPGGALTGTPQAKTTRTVAPTITSIPTVTAIPNPRITPTKGAGVATPKPPSTPAPIAGGKTPTAKPG